MPMKKIQCQLYNYIYSSEMHCIHDLKEHKKTKFFLYTTAVFLNYITYYHNIVYAYIKYQ